MREEHYEYYEFHHLLYEEVCYKFRVEQNSLMASKSKLPAAERDSPSKVSVSETLMLRSVSVVCGEQGCVCIHAISSIIHHHVTSSNEGRAFQMNSLAGLYFLRPARRLPF